VCNDLRNFLYIHNPPSWHKIFFRGGRFVYNAALVRQLCQDIAEEKDPQRVSELADLLQAVIKEDQEEIRLRISFLAKLYPAFSEFAAD
jgi:hypothetical protein